MKRYSGHRFSKVTRQVQRQAAATEREQQRQAAHDAIQAAYQDERQQTDTEPPADNQPSPQSHRTC